MRSPIQHRPDLSKMPFHSVMLASFAFVLCSWSHNVHAAVIFQQDFSSSNNVESYISGSASPAEGSLFDDIGTSDSATGFAVSVSGGQLIFDADSTVTGSAGFRSSTITPGGAPVLMQIDLTMTVSQTSGFGPIGNFSVGSASATGLDFGVGPSASGEFVNVTLRATGSDFEVENGNTTVYGELIDVPYATSIDYRMFINNSGASTAYLSPIDGSALTLDDNKYSLFLNTGSGWVAAWTNQFGRAFQSGGTPNTALEGFRFSYSRATDISLNSILIQDTFAIPEPTSALLGMVGFGILAVRRRR